jgi:archaellum biogenesis ATPase FlaH
MVTAMDYFDEDREIRPFTAEMCLHFTPPEYLIRGILSRGEVACIFGSPGAGKSMFALRMAYAVSRGDPISGMRTENGPVLYLAYEDFDGITRRIAGLYSRVGPSDNFNLWSDVGNLYAEDEEGNSYPIYKLAKYAREHRISLIVIDTLAIAFAGVEENDHKSMGRVIERAKYLADKSGAAVVIVHHGTKSEIGTPTPRGSGTLNAALDLALHVRQPSSGRIEVRSTKVKNGSNDVRLSYKIRAEQVGVDFSGDSVSAAVCEESDMDGGSKSYSKAVLALLQMLGDLQRAGPVSERELITACAAGNRVSGASQPADRVRVCRRVFHSLKDSGLIAVTEGFVSKADQ